MTVVDVDKFRNSPIGQLVPIRVTERGATTEHFAFVPATLESIADGIRLEPATYAAIEKAATELGLLEGIADQFPQPYVITRPAFRREAISTSALEGTYSTLESLFAADLDEAPPASAQLREVFNYVQAAQEGVRLCRDRPVSWNLVLQMHQTLMAGTPGQGGSGHLRTAQVAIGSRGAPVTEARFVPPPPEPLLSDLISDWEKWNYREDEFSVVARIAISHYQFEAIHPFMDGNGRMGRLLAILLLIERGPLSDHFMVLSPYLEARRQLYQDLLGETSATGNFDPWVRFFATAVSAEAEAARTRARKALAYRKALVDRLRAQGLKGTIIEVAESLIYLPVLSATAVARQCNVTFQTANRVVKRLVDENILSEITGRDYGRLFAAREVLRLLQA